jgi:hypothetical protein
MHRQGEDRRIFEELIEFLNKKKTREESPGNLIIEIGRFFLGAPYVAGILETKRAEHLIVNLTEFDCATFVENVVALTWHRASRKKLFQDFRRLLRKIRYRQGKLQGYSSRLHYFSDWIRDNQRKGIVRDMTAEIGGRSLTKAISFMTTNPDLYPPLKNRVNLRGMRSVERAISRRSLYFIPKRSLRRLEDRIRDGDLIAITTNRKGLDVQHVGFAARVKDRIHLLHASAKEGKVILSRQTLCRYLTQSSLSSGIMVARILCVGDYLQPNGFEGRGIKDSGDRMRLPRTGVLQRPH